MQLQGGTNLVIFDAGTYEFSGLPGWGKDEGEKPDPLCLCGRDIGTGDEWVLWIRKGTLQRCG